MASTVSSKHRKPKFMNNILDDIFHPKDPVCQIITTDASKKKEDVFAKLRPKAKTCLDYCISQTDTKLDAGPTKIHVQETVAEYVPDLSAPPPKKKKFKRGRYFSGGPPRWKFWDEIWLKKRVEEQKSFHKNFRKLVKERKKSEREHYLNEHYKVLALAGPAWYQELSPNQIATVDNLKNCILKDLAEGTIINTQENIAQLGLLLRPNHKHIERALKNCCKCPVEFLLILYQLINPNRTKYSINDRLLLSGVVHLTMMNTLRELHVRIPSPPRPPKVPKKLPKKKKNIKYPSPYLVPFTFKREPPKFTGIYYNKHVQRPQSPYFCYLEKFRKDLAEAAVHGIDNKSLGTQQEVDEEIDAEMVVAQTLYEQLVDFRPVPVLLKPSKYIPCDNFRTKQELAKKLEEQEREIEEDTEEQLNDNELCYYVDEETCCDAEPEITDDILDGCSCPPTSTCPCATQTEENKEKSKPETGSKPNSSVCGVSCGGSEAEQSCHFSQKGGSDVCCGFKSVKIDEPYKNCCCDQSKTNDMCFYQETQESANESEKKCFREEASLKTKEEECFYEEQTKLCACPYYANAQAYNPCNCKPEEKKKSDCKQTTQEFIDTPLCQCERCVAERKKKTTTYIISGMKETESQEVVPIIDGVLLEKPCDCLKTYQSKVEAYEREKEEDAKRPCSCQKEAKQIIERPPCPCEKCQEDRRIKGTKFIISGIKETESQERIKIIEGVSLDRPCRCLTRYETRIDQYEAYQKRKALVRTMKEQEDKYIIGGVVNTAQGPVYMITGMRPPIDCACGRYVREEEAEKRRLEMMPRMPPGRIQYAIGGVKATPQGNVYILDSALPIDDCDCMKVYEEFTGQHSTCLNMYEEYLALMKNEYNEFMTDMLPKSRQSSRMTVLDESAYAEEDEMVETMSKHETTEGSSMRSTAKSQTTGSVKSEPKSSVQESVKEEEVCGKEEKVCGHSWAYPVCCYCGQIRRIPCVECTCGMDIECVDCTCGVEEIEEEEIVEEEEIKLTRFFIFSKILCNPRWQRSVIKKALQTMADDGFPLAKLPNAHKLPHFKLWMQMRCGKFWTLQEKYEYILKSKGLWRHCEVCIADKNPFPRVPVTRAEAHKFDWSKADQVRKIVNDSLETFFRKIKQISVDFGREFFPTTFTYEFPFKTWRDCFFAYTPSKEEDVLAWFVWQAYEFKNYADTKRHCR